MKYCFLILLTFFYRFTYVCKFCSFLQLYEALADQLTDIVTDAVRV